MVKKAASCVLGRTPLCDVPKVYASVVALPAALPTVYVTIQERHCHDDIF